MDFHPLHPSPLPREDEALHEPFDVVADECMANEDHLESRNFQLQPLHVYAIVKMEPKLVRKILQMELQIQRGVKLPVQDVFSVADSELTMLRPSKIPASLLLDAQPKMSPLLQLSQFTGAIPSSGSIHQQPNVIADKGDLGEEVMSSEVTKADAPPGPPARLGSSGGASSSAARPSHPPESPRLNTGGASRTQVGDGDRIEPAENPITNESEIIEENPDLNLWPYPESTSEPESSPKCGCALVPENCCNCCCSIL